ncbi:protein SPT2-like protein [Forsythia ovata]|uniref:Protein SPT2-like protein n=1 Tax=Forsythia ovata TaxID=205694 RepID=A0ABD1P5A9_9LAMI
MKKESGTANPSSRDKNNALRKDNYGSFFGPSQPVIAPRVIQESKSLLENPNFAARVSKSNHSIQANKSSASATSGSKPRVDHPSRVTNGVKTKVEMLKNTRDYSFLLSDDAEVPAPMKNPPPRNASAPNSEARSAQLLQRSKQPAKDSGKKAVTGHLERKPMPAGGQLRPKVGSEKLAPASKLSMGSKQKLGMNNGSGPGRPVGMKVTPSRNPAATTGKKVTAPVAKSSMPGERKPIPSRLQPQVHKPNPSQLQSSVPKKPLIQRKESRETSKAKVIPKQPMSSSRPQVKPLPPKSSARGTLADEHPKRKPVSRYDENSDDDVQAISMIRKMFGYNPNKYRDDDDDSDMEANFDDILAEEKRSAIIARKEDEEQLRLIEEEERRERMRLAKRQKR